MITLGIDLGTSAVKAVLLEDDRLLASATQSFSLSRPHPGWSEQDPADWWRATCGCIDTLRAAQPAMFTALRTIGLSGQMHGATLLGNDGRTLRPCMLWNDGRSSTECAELEARWPALRQVTGNPAMPGFTAPKLLWVRKHEAGVFAQLHKVLLPKAWLAHQLTGEYVEEMSDASGTLWLDVAARRWSDAALDACGLGLEHMPRLVEGNAVAAELRPEWVRRWGLQHTPLVAGGAGDNAAGAVAVGAVHPGDAFVSLGTSGVLWATTERFAPQPDRAVHTFCHAVPDTWHQMGVLLAAASCLGWWAQVTGLSEAQLLGELAAEIKSGVRRPTSGCWFAPYLSGERTPHNDVTVRGGFLGLDGGTRRVDMTRAVLEGVAYALRDAQQALAAAGTQLSQADLLGGGARSPLWAQLLADVLGMTLHQVADAEVGCALGAARLARMAAGADLSIATRPRRLGSYEPNLDAAAFHDERHAQWQRLYPLARDFARAPSAWRPS